MAEEGRPLDPVKKQLGPTKIEFQKRIQEREKELRDLRQAVQSLKSSAQAAVEDSERIFTEMISSIKRRCSEVKQLIRDQEKAEVSRAKGLLERLEQEIAELTKRDTELQDDIHFLQSCQSLCAPPGPGNLFEAVRESVSELKEQLEGICKKGLSKISQTAKVCILRASTREDFLQHFCGLTLDLNTANRNLHLSEGNRVVTCRRGIFLSGSFPDPERFDLMSQVLCKEGQSGHSYWEAEWKGDGGVFIAVTYNKIKRKGISKHANLGYNDNSWALSLSHTSCSFLYNKEHTKIPVPPSPKIGVYLDKGAGTLSFYSVGKYFTHLHTFLNTFTQSLYPAFGVYGNGSMVRLCDLSQKVKKDQL